MPAAAYYGIHTARALANFPITGDTLARYPLLIAALAAVKQAAAAAPTNVAAAWTPTIAAAIIDACQRDPRRGASRPVRRRPASRAAPAPRRT